MLKVTIMIILLFVLALFPGRNQQLPRVIVLSTGGTIASKYDATKGGFAPALTGAQLVDAVPDLKKVVRLEVEQVASVGSADITPEIWLKLSRRANELLTAADVAGVVITHGTDTLEETAWFLDLTITSPKPVILVGRKARLPFLIPTDRATCSTQRAWPSRPKPSARE